MLGFWHLYADVTDVFHNLRARDGLRGHPVEPLEGTIVETEAQGLGARVGQEGISTKSALN